MNPIAIEASRTFFADESLWRGGRLYLAGISKGSAGVGPRMRVYGRFAIVLLLQGRGIYHDARGTKREVIAGDAVLVLPELPHIYGPRPAKSRGGQWDEIYLCFDGPLFELWRREGLIDDSLLVRSVADPRALFERLRTLCELPRPQSAFGNSAHLRELLAILADVFPPRENSHTEPLWLSRARSVLESNLDQNLGGRDAARAANLSYEAFRRAWTRTVGVSPNRYRDQNATRSRADSSRPKRPDAKPNRAQFGLARRSAPLAPLSGTDGNVGSAVESGARIAKAPRLTLRPGIRKHCALPNDSLTQVALCKKALEAVVPFFFPGAN